MMAYRATVRTGDGGLPIVPRDSGEFSRHDLLQGHKNVLGIARERASRACPELWRRNVRGSRMKVSDRSPAGY
jgi:hypothetical protein